jgi:hypothetical protein
MASAGKRQTSSAVHRTCQLLLMIHRRLRWNHALTFRTTQKGERIWMG